MKIRPDVLTCLFAATFLGISAGLLLASYVQNR